MIETATSYKSGDTSVQRSQVQENRVTYYGEDIYLKSVTNPPGDGACHRTAACCPNGRSCRA